MAIPSFFQNMANHNSDHISTDEKPEIDWIKEMQKKLIDAHSDRDAMWKKFMTALQRNKELAVKNKQMEHDLANAEAEILQLKEALSVQGAVKDFESRMLSLAPRRCLTVRQKVEWLYKNNKRFRTIVRKYVKNCKTSEDVGMLVENLYASATRDVHNTQDGFVLKNKGIILREKNYHNSHIQILKTICKMLKLKIKII